MPSRISATREVAYLRALAETRNASLAAAHAGVSRDWAYKRRKQDARFGARCREMAALAREKLPARVNRPRAGGWSPEREQRFLDALAATHDVEVAAGSAGMTAPSAYRRRAIWPELARRWEESLSAYEPHMESEWIASARCFFD